MRCPPMEKQVLILTLTWFVTDLDNYAFTKLLLNKYILGAIAEEVLSSIRTVLAFGGEKREVERYSAEVAVARKSGIFRGILTGTTMVSHVSHFW